MLPCEGMAVVGAFDVFGVCAWFGVTSKWRKIPLFIPRYVRIDPASGCSAARNVFKVSSKPVLKEGGVRFGRRDHVALSLERHPEVIRKRRSSTGMRTGSQRPPPQETWRTVGKTRSSVGTFRFFTI